MESKDFDQNKFRFRELVTNRDGKTSGSGFVGLLLGLTAVIVALGGTVGWYTGMEGWTDAFEYSIKLGGISALLMGARKGFNTKEGRSSLPKG